MFLCSNLYGKQCIYIFPYLWNPRKKNLKLKKNPPSMKCLSIKCPIYEMSQRHYFDYQLIFKKIYMIDSQQYPWLFRQGGGIFSFLYTVRRIELLNRRTTWNQYYVQWTMYIVHCPVAMFYVFIGIFKIWSLTVVFQFHNVVSLTVGSTSSNW